MKENFTCGKAESFGANLLIDKKLLLHELD